MDVWVNGQRLRLDPAHLLGKGGEAEVFDLGALALKVFKTPDHPDLHGNPAEQDAARLRLSEHQRKLALFPRGLPPRVVTPQALATDRRGRNVLGYTMRKVERAEPLLRYADPAFRLAVPGNEVLALFRDLQSTVEALHRANVVIGDFNDLNVLVHGAQAHVIDADSFQYAGFLCGVFTERFVDPLLVEPSARTVSLRSAFGPDSDWYAFHALLFQSLLLTAPYGGVHRPPAGQPRLTTAERLHQRLTVLRPGVQYPRPARPLASLPDELLHHFDAVLHQDARGAPEPRLLSLRFERCPSCQLEHARRACPVCQPNAGARTQHVTSTRGRVVAQTLFETRGVVIEAAHVGGTLRVVHHDGTGYRAADGTLLVPGPPTPHLRFLLAPKDIWLQGPDGLQRCLTSGKEISRSVDGRRPADVSGLGLFFASAGQLWRTGPHGDEPVGAVMQNQTWLFAGPTFGAGLYRAGNLTVAFTFPRVRELDAQLRLRGELTAVDAAVGHELAWLRCEERQKGRSRVTLRVLSRDGRLVGSLDGAEETPWATTPLERACALGEQLFVPTDAGIVRVDLVQGVPELTRSFPDTEPFVSSATRLRSDGQGLIAVNERRIQRLSMT